MEECLRPWRDDYQLLCSIDSVSGEMKGISPFLVPSHIDQADHSTCAEIKSHHKVITSITEFEESKSFRAKLGGHMSAMWRSGADASMSALDKAKVNSKDMYAYYSIQFTKSRVVVQNHKLINLRLNQEAIEALRRGTFKEVYGDMIVVGYKCGGEAEAVLKVSKFDRSRQSTLSASLNITLNGGHGGVSSSESLSNELKDTTTTIYSRRTGVTSKKLLENSNDFGQLVKALTKSAQNEGAKIYALCYRAEQFSQITKYKNNVLNREVVDEIVSTLQKQFTLVQYAINTMEWYLEKYQATKGGVTSSPMRKETLDLRDKALDIVKRFDKLKGYREIMSLKENDIVLRAGYDLQAAMQDLEAKYEIQQTKEDILGLQPGAKGLAANGTSGGGSADSISSAGGVSGPYIPGPAQTGRLACHIKMGRNFQQNKIGSIISSLEPYAVLRLGNVVIGTSPKVHSSDSKGGPFNWDYTFIINFLAQQLKDDDQLELEIYDSKAIGKDTFLGCIRIQLQSAVRLGTKLAERAGVLKAAPDLGLKQQLEPSLVLLPEDMGEMEDQQEKIWYPVEKPHSIKYKCRGELHIDFALKPPVATGTPSPLPPAPPPPFVGGSGPRSSESSVSSFGSRPPSVLLGISFGGKPAYDQIWAAACLPGNSCLGHDEVLQVLKGSELTDSVLFKIWESCAKDKLPLDKRGFYAMMDHVAAARKELSLELPPPLFCNREGSGVSEDGPESPSRLAHTPWLGVPPPTPRSPLPDGEAAAGPYAQRNLGGSPASAAPGAMYPVMPPVHPWQGPCDAPASAALVEATVLVIPNTSSGGAKGEEHPDGQEDAVAVAQRGLEAKGKGGRKYDPDLDKSRRKRKARLVVVLCLVGLGAASGGGLFGAKEVARRRAGGEASRAELLARKSWKHAKVAARVSWRHGSAGAVVAARHTRTAAKVSARVAAVGWRHTLRVSKVALCATGVASKIALQATGAAAQASWATVKGVLGQLLPWGK